MRGTRYLVKDFASDLHDQCAGQADTRDPFKRQGEVVRRTN